MLRIPVPVEYARRHGPLRICVYPNWAIAAGGGWQSQYYYRCGPAYVREEVPSALAEVLVRFLGQSLRITTSGLGEPGFLVRPSIVAVVRGPGLPLPGGVALSELQLCRISPDTVIAWDWLLTSGEICFVRDAATHTLLWENPANARL